MLCVQNSVFYSQVVWLAIRRTLPTRRCLVSPLRGGRENHQRRPRSRGAHERRSAACACVRLFACEKLWWLAFVAISALADDGPQAAISQERIFLLRYVGLTATSNIAALDLYRDDGSVRVTSYSGERETVSGLVQDKDWKQQLPAGWFEGTTRLESSSFASASVITAPPMAMSSHVPSG